MRLADLPHPGGAIVRAAEEVAAKYYSPALANHCLRSYFWAASFGLQEGIDFDPELLFVSAMFHDIGIVTAFDNFILPFEEAGGHVAWVFGAAAGWPVERRRRMAEIIIRHMWDDVNVEMDPEGHLLWRATGLDITGHDSERWPFELLAEVVNRFPRGRLGDEFLRCFKDQARRKPESAAAAVVASGVAQRIAANVLDSIAVESGG